MVSRSFRTWWSIGLSAVLLWGCSASGDGDGGGRRQPTGGGAAGTTDPGMGGTGGETNFGQTPGSPPLTSGTMAPMVQPPPTIDASAAPYTQDDTGASGLDQGTIDMLKQGGGSCNVNVTYPYEGTRFPGALAPPIIMWDGAHDGAYAHFAYDKSDAVNYEFAVGSGGQGELQIGVEAWNEITRRTNNLDLIITLNVLSGGAVSSCQLHWRVAPGNMVGSLFYNTYQAPNAINPDNGAVMRLVLGAVQAEIYKQYMGALNLLPSTGPCYACHSVSFDGSTMVASFHNYEGKVFEVEKYSITQDVEPASEGMVHNANFGALTPDGSRILAQGNPQCTGGSDTFPRRPNNIPLIEGPAVARMLTTADGSDTGAAGLDPNVYMWMPQFSPDGDKVVFNHAKPDGAGGTDRSELAIMDYDYDTNTFSNLRVVASGLGPQPTLPYSPAPALGGQVPCGEGGCAPDGVDPATWDCNLLPPPLIPGDVGALNPGSCAGPCYPAWPFFTPDGKGVVFAMISEPDFANAFPGRDAASQSELWYVDVETLEVIKLDNANRGLAPGDSLANYYPTVLPVAIGGYFWAFFTSTREWGHKLVGLGAGGVNDAIQAAIRKRIWVTAIKPRITVDAEVVAEPGPLMDPSSPPFYLDGQSASGNVRAFAALNPCLPDLSECASGLDCCCGFCTIDDGAATGQCCLEIPTCAKTNEKCDTSADCCPPESPDEPQNECIGGFCTFILLE